MIDRRVLALLAHGRWTVAGGSKSKEWKTPSDRQANGSAYTKRIVSKVEWQSRTKRAEVVQRRAGGRWRVDTGPGSGACLVAIAGGGRQQEPVGGMWLPERRMSGGMNDSPALRTDETWRDGMKHSLERERGVRRKWFERATEGGTC